MTHKTRTVLFLFLLILFLLVAPLTVFYSLGWRFNWEFKKIVQPGIFYFKIWPKNVQIYLDGNLVKKTDFFFSSALIENLLSKKYNVEIKKEGFHTWKKTLEIKKRQVTETKNIVLIPENPDFTIITRGTKEFFFSSDGKKIILKEMNEEGWALKLFEIDKKVKSHLIRERDILARRSFSEGGSKEKVQLFDLKFSPDSSKVLLELGLEERIDYYLLEIDKVPPVLTSLGSLERPEQVFLSSPLEKDVITLTISDDNIYYLDSLGFLFKGEKRLNLIPFRVKEETDYKITVSNSYVLLEENDILYLFDQDKKSFQKLFEPIKNHQFSPDSQKLVYFNNYEIWVLFLEKKNDQPQKEAGDKLFITRFSEKIDEVFWYTSHYLVFNVGGKIKIAEIDDRDKINIVELAEFKEPKIFWNNKKLYILSEENLYVSEELTP